MDKEILNLTPREKKLLACAIDYPVIFDVLSKADKKAAKRLVSIGYLIEQTEISEGAECCTLFPAIPKGN